MADLPPPRFERSDVGVYRRSLPHWRIEGGVYFVIFRLADALPRQTLETYRRERQTLDGASHEDPRAAIRLYCRTMDRALDAGTGSCLLRRPELARIVHDALRHFDGERYRLYASVVMPNHAHVVVRPETSDLASVLKSWKSFTARQIHRRTGDSGALWQHESFDHLIRHVGDLHRFCRYTYENPEKAGLHDWPWRYLADNLPTEDL